MKDNYLQTSVELWTLVIVWSANNGLLTAVVTKEVELEHIVGFFRTQRRVGMYERMAPMPEEVVGEGPMNTVNAVNGEAARHLDLKYLTRKTQAKDLKNAKVFLQRGLLSAEGIEHFDT